jgi:RHS repeat-associated protein
LKTPVYRRRLQINHTPTRRLQFEALEQRKLLAVSWTGLGDGTNWHDSNNWSGLTIPVATDDVVIDVPSNPSIAFSSNTGTRSVRSLITRESIVFQGGALQVETSFDVDATVTLAGGTIRNATVNSTPAGTLLITNGTLDGVTLNSDLTLSGSLTVNNRLTVNSVLTVSGSGSLFFNNGSHTLDGTGQVVLDGATMRLGSSGLSTVTIGPELTLRGRGSITHGNSSGSIALTNRGTIKADVPGQTLNILPNLVPKSLVNEGVLIAEGGGKLQVDGLTGNLNSAQVNGTGSHLQIGGTNWTNNLGLSAPAGTFLSLHGTWTNAANITADGSTLTLGSGTNAWSNTSRIEATDTTTNLGGLFTVAGLGVFERSGGTVNLTGTLNNTGTTLELNAITGSWNMTGGVGTVQGGTLITGGGSTLLITNGILDSVTLNSDLSLSGSLTVNNRLTVNGVLTVSGSGSLFFNSGSHTLDGTGQVVLDHPGVATRLGFLGHSTLTIGPELTLRGRGTITNFGSGASSTVINQGTIQADVAGQLLQVSTTSFSNEGNVIATGGGRLQVTGLTGNLNSAQVSGTGSHLQIGGTNWINNLGLGAAAGTSLSLQGAWTNAANITADGSTLTLGSGTNAWSNTSTIEATNTTTNLGGLFTVAGLGVFERNGGTVNLTGTLNNTGTTLELNAATGSWNMTGGVATIQGGTVITGAGATLLITNGILDGVTLNSNLTLSGSLTVNNRLTVNSLLTVASTGSLFFNNGTHTLDGTGQVVLDGATMRLGFLGHSTLTIGPELTLRGRGSIINFGSGTSGTVINQGIIQADVPGQTLTVVLSQGVINRGLFQATDGGTLRLEDFTNHQSIRAQDSTLTFGGNWSNSGEITAHNSTTNLGGSFTLARLGTFNRTGGTVRLTGSLNNTGTTLGLNAATGSWILAGGGTIQGGAVTTADAATLVIGNGTFDGVTLNTNLTIGDSGTLIVTNGLVLNGVLTLASGTDFASLAFGPGNQTLSGSGQVVLIGPAASVQGSAITVASGITIRGRGAINRFSTNGLINQGTIIADVVGQSLSIGGFVTNQGLLQAAGGDLTVNNLEPIDNSAAIGSRSSSTITINGNLLGATRNSSLNKHEGILRLSGGTVAAPRLLEAMSLDQGNVVSGFTGPFAYATLALSSGAYVRLVELSDNAPGVGTEVVYAGGLIVPAGATLDLAGKTLYARTVQRDGQIINGAVIQAVDSGPFTVGMPVPGIVNIPGELDEWSFYGRAGRSLSVVLNASGNPTAGTPQPTNPPLTWGEVSLLSPTGELIATASATLSGQILTLNNITLPVEGLYRIQVRAAAGHSSSTGNYYLAAYDVTTDRVPLLLNQQTLGQIATPFNSDVWTLALEAGQQIRFDLLSSNSSGLLFSLEGPDGYQPFQNFTGDSELITIPAGRGGNYTLTVRAPQDGTGNYSFALRETTVLDLNLGAPASNQLAGDGSAWLYKVSAPGSTPLFITFDDSVNTDLTELYVRKGAPPTRGEYDYSHTLTSTADHTILVPSASAGDWYVLVYGRRVPNPSSFTIQAVANSVYATSVTPDRIAAGNLAILTIAGAGFVPGTTVTLIDAQGSVLFPVNVVRDTFTQLTAEFDLTGVAGGVYDVRVTVPSGESDTLIDRFTVLPAGEAKLEINLVVPSGVRTWGANVYYVEYANTGTAAMPAPLLVLQASDPNDRPFLTLDQTLVSSGFWSFGDNGIPIGFSESVLILASSNQPGVLNPGEKVSVPVYYIGARAIAGGALDMEVRFWTADDPTPIDWSQRQEELRPTTFSPEQWSVVYSNLTSGLTTTGDYVRMLSDNSRYLGQLGQRVTDVGELWKFELQQAYGYNALATIDSAVDAAMTTPGVSLFLSRTFAGSLQSRNAQGMFGQGWFTPWDTTLLSEDNGRIVRIVGQGGSARVFSLDSRNGSYFASAGESSALRRTGSTYELRDSSGMITYFNAQGKISAVEDPNGNRVSASYDAQNRLVLLLHSNGASISLIYNAFGKVATASDSAGRVTTLEYDAAGQYLLSATAHDGQVTRYTYDTAGAPSTRHALLSVERVGVTQHFRYDTQGRIDETYLANQQQRIDYSYDTAGTVIITSAAGIVRLFYDHKGLLAKAVDGLGQLTSYTYGSDLRLAQTTLATGETQHYTWCSCGNLTSYTDELGNRTTFTYDTFDGFFRRRSGFTDAKGNTTRYTYDADGNLLTTVYANGTIERLGGYDDAGLAHTSTNRRGQLMTLTYNAAGQITIQTFSDGSSVQYQYDPRGNLLSVTDGAEVTNYTYEYATTGDRLRRVTYPNGRYVDYSYDPFGRRSVMTTHDGHTTKYEYDNVGRLFRLRDGSDTILVTYHYDAAGRQSRVEKGNGTFTTYDYDEAGQLRSLVNHRNETEINSRFDYTYDARGRRTSMATLDGVWHYSYDATSQLIRAVFTSVDTSVIPDQDLRYEYDALGNRIRTLLNGVTTEYSTNNLNQYTSVGGVAYTYDADGNLTFDGENTYVFDQQNRLVRVTGPSGVTEYEYDAFGMRTATIHNGERTEYLLDPFGLVDVIAEYGASGLIARNTHGVGLVSRDVAGMGSFYYEFDAIGSTAGLTDFAGLLVNQYRYLPFGETIGVSEAVANPFEFVGAFGVMKEDSGLQFMRARYYDVTAGRLMSPDPIRLAGGDVNFYRYAANDPIRFVDPTGLWTKGIVDSHENDGEDAGRLGCYFARLCIPNACAGTFPEFPLPKPGDPPPTTPFPGLCKPPDPPDPPEPDDGEKGDGDSSRNVTPADPNDKIGAGGYGDAAYIDGASLIPYRIRFENLGPGSKDPDGNPYPIVATAPAQRITISDQLDSDLDWSTFALAEMGFGDTVLAIPAGSQHFEQLLSVTIQGHSFDVWVYADFDSVTGLAQFVFQSLDPLTGLPPDAFAGLLPPEDGTGIGQGFVRYTIEPKQGLPTGTEIRNVALIRFDDQTIIATNQVDPLDATQGTDPAKEALNTIDADAPESAVTALPAQAAGSSFEVDWSGSDLGAGIATFDIYVSVDGGAFAPWLLATSADSAIYTGEAGHSYAFYSVAVDHVGRREFAPAGADTTTTVPFGNTVPVLEPIGNRSVAEGNTFSFTAAAHDPDDGQSLTFSLAPGAPEGASIDPVTGEFTWTPQDDLAEAIQITIVVTDNGPGALFASETIAITVETVAPVTAVAGPTDAVRGQSRRFTLLAQDDSPVDQGAGFTFDIDWNGDGTIDQSIAGPSGLELEHVFSEAGNYEVRVRATDKDGSTSNEVATRVVVTPFALQANAASGRMDLVWGGMTGNDVAFFIPTMREDTILVFAMMLDGQVVNQRHSVSGVTGQIVAYGQAGDDTLIAELVQHRSVQLFGDDGNDVLVGGFRSDTLDGGDGNDILLSGTWTQDQGDVLRGGRGRDLLVGHWGGDTFDGGEGDDLLIAGRLNFSDLPSAVMALHAEWTSERDYSTRISNLTGQGVGPRSNGNTFLQPGITVLDDGAVDTLIGGDDLDWFLLNPLEDEADEELDEDLLAVLP